MIDVSIVYNRKGRQRTFIVDNQRIDVDTSTGYLWHQSLQGQKSYDIQGADVLIQACTYQTSERCQYCGNSWQQTRTIGTPRLDAVPCPSCKRLV